MLSLNRKNEVDIYQQFVRNAKNYVEERHNITFMYGDLI